MAPKKSTALTKEEGGSIEELLVTIARRDPIELEERIGTLDKPLILECACPGWQPKYWGPPRAYPVRKPQGYKERGVRYPAVPCSVEEQVQAIVESVKAGTAAVHIHPRDPKDCLSVNDSQLMKEIYDKIYEQVDVIPLQHTRERTEDGEVDYAGSLAKELLKLGGNGNRYCQGAVMLWPPGDSYPPDYTRYAQEGARFMEEHDIKPIHKLRSTYGVRRMKRDVIDTKMLTKEPFILVHDMGHPFGWPMDMDPWMPIDLITSIAQTKQRLGEHHVIGVY